ncbi:MAG: GDP-mannose 4,6-dehydratase [Candidatus Omnitrophica bacterium]|nr:GDP-mannose 4,6-dehydratase [Candidatus Omnitrophota bacterium]HOX55143.1 GDP-mannose 4,6-dehydratase [Candidatus Omnitrophota bacterium]
MINKKFWKNKKVFISGYEGFLGSNLTKKLISLGADVVGLDIKVRRKETILCPSDYNKIKVIKGSIADYHLIKNIIEKNKIEVVFHLAAEAIVGKCLQNPRKTFISNIKGTWELLEVCRYTKTVKSIVVASSDKAYGSHKKLPYKEDTPLRGEHPYDVSKSCADLITYAYFHTFGLPVAITRCGNIYGPGDFNFNRIVPDAIRCALTDRRLMIRSDGKFIRDYIFIDDIVDAYLLLAEKIRKSKQYGEALNFSNENPISVLKLVKIIYESFNKKPNFRVLNQARYEIRNQYLSSKKSKEILGWQPRYSLKNGINKTIDWYKTLSR